MTAITIHRASVAGERKEFSIEAMLKVLVAWVNRSRQREQLYQLEDWQLPQLEATNALSDAMQSARVEVEEALAGGVL